MILCGCQTDQQPSQPYDRTARLTERTAVEVKQPVYQPAGPAPTYPALARLEYKPLGYLIPAVDYWRGPKYPQVKKLKKTTWAKAHPTYLHRSSVSGGSVGASKFRGHMVHVVRPGDTLYFIAKRYYGRGDKWKLIYEANRSILKNPNLLSAGEEIYVPRSGLADKNGFIRSAKHAPDYYITAPGDTLAMIARITLGNSGRWGQIAERNQITNPNLLRAGIKLKIRE